MNEDYVVYEAESMKIRAQMNSIMNVPLFPGVSIEWNDTPGFAAKGMPGFFTLFKFRK